ANRSIATGVKPADCSEHRKLLQDEIEVSRWPAISPIQIGATVTTGLNRLAFLLTIEILVVARPSLPLRVSLRPPSRLHFEPGSAAIRDLNKFAAAFASARG